MATPRFIHFTSCNFSENEALLLWASCCPRRGCATPLSSGILFEYPEICAARQARNTRFETRAGTMMMMGRRMSAGCGRCCRPQTAVMSSYSILGQVFPRVVRNRKFHTASPPNRKCNPGPRADPVSPWNWREYSVRRCRARRCWTEWSKNGY